MLNVEINSVSSAVELTLTTSLLFIEWRMIVSFPAFPLLRSCLDFELISLNEIFFAVACQLSGCQKKFRKKLFLFSRDRKSLI